MKQNTTRNLVVAGTVLFASTISIIYSDINRDRIKYKNELQSEIKLNEKLQNSYDKQHEALLKEKKINSELNKQIKLKSNEIHRLKKQLEKASHNNESPMRKLNMTITAYVSNCRGCSGKTFTEYNVKNTIYYKGMRIVATDPSVIPLYSIIEIKLKSGKKIKAIAIDKGGLIRGKILDFLVEDYQTAIEFGRQDAEVTVLREGK